MLSQPGETWGQDWFRARVTRAVARGPALEVTTCRCPLELLNGL